MPEDQDQEDYQSDLGKAIAMWRSGKNIPVDLFANLAEQGYDVPAMEAKYFNYDI